MEYKVEHIPSRNVVYMRNIGPYGSEENYELMKRFKKWIRFNNFWDKVEKNGVYGIARDNPELVAAEKCRYDVMLDIETDIRNSEVRNGIFKGGKYIVFEIEHTNQAVSNFFSDLGLFLNKKEIEVRNEPIIERYKEEEGVDKICEILVPIF
ncbi:AraC family transcriptional regulator [Staphylococcus capitis]|uniref:AraC family transcriptional regulator n=1 Tax=Staphylococcus capitis TaxID=29388 RepID=UPI0038210005